MALVHERQLSPSSEAIVVALRSKFSELPPANNGDSGTQHGWRVASRSEVLSKRRVFRKYGFDLLVGRAGSEELERYVSFFQQVRLEPGKKKGIPRMVI